MHSPEVQELVDQAEALPYGAAKVALLERAAALADSLNDVQSAYNVRFTLIDAGEFSGRQEVAIVAFSWCRSVSQRDPERFPISELLWRYKWMVHGLVNFPQITQGRIDAALDEMERLYKENGASPYAVWFCRRNIALDQHNLDEARRCHREWQRHRRDGLSDCIACVDSKEVAYHDAIGEPEKAVAAFDKMLKLRRRCTHEPHIAYSQVLSPLVRLQQWDEARRHHSAGYRLVRRGDEFVLARARHLRFLASDGNLTAARRVVANHLAAVLRHPNPFDRLHFLIGVGAYAAAAVGKDLKKVTLTPPDEMNIATHNGKIDPAALLIWCRDTLGPVADQFDARNGNQALRTTLEEALAV